MSNVNVDTEDMIRHCCVSSDGRDKFVVDVEHVADIMGGPPRTPDDIGEMLSTCGVAIGLAVTGAGGRVLFIEAAKTRGSGAVKVTGQLGSVMSESVYAAFSFLKTKADLLRRACTASQPKEDGASPWEKLAFQDWEHIDVHVHFPDGATPKDGPSAGLAVVLALMSALTEEPCRSDTAVTGEVSLRGHALPIGGVKEKVLAAIRHGVRHVFLPQQNLPHVNRDLPEQMKKEVEVHTIKLVDELLEWHFGKPDWGTVFVVPVAGLPVDRADAPLLAKL